MHALLLILLQLYMAMFGKESDEAVSLIEDNAALIRSNMPNISADERLMAMAIVAPEISQFSSVTDFMEMRSLFVTYRNFGRGDFSVGLFQMKPSFIESLEKEINSDTVLKKRYAEMLPSGDAKGIRTTRLKRLGKLEWQLKYLEVFIEVVKQKTKKLKFKNNREKLRYWATLYNSGFNSSPERVAAMQKKTYFPHSSKKFNYADVAEEFYNTLSQKRNIF